LALPTPSIFYDKTTGLEHKGTLFCPLVQGDGGSHFSVITITFH
jgi:hypothetical protein